MNLDQVTPLILTWNEEANIVRCLAKLNWAKRIVVIDSFSTDQTMAILKQCPQVSIFQREFDSHSNQWNFGLEQVQTEWILSLDADYILSEELISEIQSLETTEDGYWIDFRYFIGGKALRRSLLPPRLALFKKKQAAYVQDGHTQLLKLQVATGHLRSAIWHDDRKSFSRWWNAQKKYVMLETEKLITTSFKELSLPDKIRTMILFAPAAAFFYCLFYKGLILDGWKGIVYSWQRFLTEQLLAFKLLKKLFNRNRGR